MALVSRLARYPCEAVGRAAFLVVAAVTQLLPLPEGETIYSGLVEMWNAGLYERHLFPRSVWLRDFEDQLRITFPQSSNRDRKLTARHYAPFWLRDGHDVP